MNLVRMVPLVLLLAACSRIWIDVAEGTSPIDCAGLRLSARGYVVDHAFTDSIRLRVIKQEGAAVDTITAEILFPPDTAYVRVESDWWAGKPNARERVGSNLAHKMEVMNAMESCGIPVYGRRRAALDPPPSASPAARG